MSDLSPLIRDLAQRKAQLQIDHDTQSRSGIRYEHKRVLAAETRGRIKEIDYLLRLLRAVLQ